MVGMKTLKWWTGLKAEMPIADALYGILKYPEDLSQAVSIGNAVSALKNTVPGDFPAMDLSEIRELIQEHKANGPVMEMKR